MILNFEDIFYNQWISGVWELTYRLAVVSWFGSTISLSLNILRAIERWGELQRRFFRASGQLAVSLKKRSQRSSVKPPKRPFFRAGGLLAIWLVESNVCINMCISIFVVC
jgi:hypothetical protein